MATTRLFARYTGGGTPSGTERYGDLLVGVDASNPYNSNYSGVKWWSGADEDLGYIIATTVATEDQPTPNDGNTGSVGFFRTDNFDDNEFIDLVKVVSGYQATSAIDAKTWLESNGYWTSYSDIAIPVLSLDAADYTSGDWIDSIGSKSFVLYNSPTWSASNGGYFNFNTSLSQSVRCSTSLPSLGTWSVAVWHYYTGTETGAAPCIITETFIGGGINYSLGKNLAPFSVGFFNGSWRITDGYSLTPNNWYYIVGTYDGSTIKLYVNNTLVDSTNYTGTPTSSGAGIRLMERWDLSDYWGGRLATVDIYDKALGNSEIESIWNLTKSRFGL
jgi:hypothetical protein